jgi:toxin-antitoxin system PIN domain toxin
LLPDVNVLVYAHRPTESDMASRVREWLWSSTERGERLALSTAVLASMVRIVTHPRILDTPSTPRDALTFTRSLLDDPQASVVVPTSRHWPIFQELVEELRLVGNDVPDAYIAALALDYGATLVSTDRGFRRFPGLRLVNPLATGPG